jgi:DNA-binding transcriptional ArsR family regulator
MCGSEQMRSAFSHLVADGPDYESAEDHPEVDYLRSARGSTMSDKGKIDRRLINAYAHPLRVEILHILSERVASPIEMSKDLGEPIGTVAYHVKVLSKWDLIEEVNSEPRRGAVEHYFKSTPNSALGAIDWDGVPPGLRQNLAAASLATLVPQLITALEAETLENRDSSFLSWQPLTVDELGRKEVAEILGHVDARLKAVAKESRRRLKAQDGISVVAVVGAVDLPGRRRKKQ